MLDDNRAESSLKTVGICEGLRQVRLGEYLNKFKCIQLCVENINKFRTDS